MQWCATALTTHVVAMSRARHVQPVILITGLILIAEPITVYM